MGYGACGVVPSGFFEVGAPHKVMAADEKPSYPT